MQIQKPKQGYKLVKSLFGKSEEIPEEWNKTNLIQLCTNKPEYGANVPAIEKNVGLPRYIRITDLNDDGSLRDDEWKSILEQHARDYLLKEGDIVFARTGATVGKTYLYRKKDGKCAFAGYLIRFVPDKGKLDPDFLFYYTHSTRYWRWLDSIQTWGVQPNVNAELYSYMPLLLPTVPEQQKIASILLNVDSLIQQTQKEIEQTQRLKKGLMQRLLTKGIGHTKFKGCLFTNHGRISLGSIPEKWDLKTVKELEKEAFVIDYQDGNHGELHPKTSDFTQSGKPFLTASQIDENGNILLSECKKLPEHFWKKLRIGFSQAKDVLFTHNATVGRVAVLPEDFPDCIVGTSITYYRLNEEKIDRFYFGYILRSNFIIKQYSTEMDQTTRQQFSILKQAKLKIPLPKLKEQQKIASILSNVDSQIKKQQESKTHFETLKKGLMQKLLTGQIRVKV